MLRGLKYTIKKFIFRNYRIILFTILILSLIKIFIVKNNEDLISESIENDDDEVENCHSVTNDLNSYLIDKINDNKEELKHENCKNQDWILIDKSGICSYNKEYLDDNNLIIKSCFYSIILTNSDNFDSSYTISSQKYELKDGTELNNNFEFFYISCKADKENTFNLFSYKYQTAYARILKPKFMNLNEQEPINILFLGLDSISKIGWLNNLPKSSKFLIERLEVNILNRYNIVGDG